jgi:hypothetical protein
MTSILDAISSFGKLSSDMNFLGMITGPCLGYIIQTRSMIIRQSPEGFSTYCSFVLLLSNVIRVYWWLATPFNLVVLGAAILMIGC